MKKISALMLAILFLWSANIVEKESHKPTDFKVVTLTVQNNQTLWDIANKNFENNPYQYKTFADYYCQIIEENKHLQNSKRMLQIGDKVKIKVKKEQIQLGEKNESKTARDIRPTR